jgi:hypothetical protein
MADLDRLQRIAEVEFPALVRSTAAAGKIIASSW